MPLVSVVIPTLGRPKLLLRAVNSVIRQTHQDFEILAVIDRQDTETADAVRSVNDSRVKLVLNRYSLTASGARNSGADDATGEWIAFLDDDDEWLPNKLQRQLALASPHPATLVTCLSRVVTPTGNYIRPKRIYDSSVPIGDYLFDRRTLLGGSSFMQTSSYLLPRSLFDKVRFDVDSPHDDWGFLLRLARQRSARIQTVPEVLAILHFEEARPSLTSRTSSWVASLKYLEEIQLDITSHAYSGYCLGVVGERAAREGAYSAFPELLYRAFRSGSPRLWHLLPYLAYWLAPPGLLRQIRASVRGSLRPRRAVYQDALDGIGRK
jgi:glycosyltransferase involved in cell wall biosynthesis